jgi:hypothetical protein
MTTFTLSSSILSGLFVWTALFPLLLLLRRWLRVGGVGLDMAFLAILFIGHAPGGFLYLLPWYFTVYDGFAVEQGFELSWIGVTAYAAAVAIGLIIFRTRRPDTFEPTAPSPLYHPNTPLLLFGIGLVSYLVLQPIANNLASINSIVINLTNLQIIGIGLGIWQGIVEGNRTKALRWLLVTPLLPFLTITTAGFIGYGVVSVVVVLTFLLSHIKLRWWYIFVTIAIVYGGLSVYVTYMQGRDEIRASVWGEEEYIQRVDTLTDQFVTWGWFDWRNQDHLALIDGRLNQNFLVGVARMNLDNGLVQYAEGETLYNAFIAFIPRIIWRDKPVIAGGSETVTKYTLIEFYGGTSVAAGQVMEFYINFGMVGLITGFGAMGLLMAWVDSRAARRLYGGNFYSFLRWYIVGIALLKPTDDLTVLVGGAASAFVTAILLEYSLRWWFTRQSNAKAALAAPRPTFPISPSRR